MFLTMSEISDDSGNDSTNSNNFNNNSNKSGYSNHSKNSKNSALNPVGQSRIALYGDIMVKNTHNGYFEYNISMIMYRT